MRNILHTDISHLEASAMADGRRTHGLCQSELGVFIGRTRVGGLRKCENEATLFRPDPSAPEDLVVSLAWTKAQTEIVSSPGSLHPVFDQHLPEGMLRHHLRDAFCSSFKNKDDLEMLRIVGSSLIGRLRFAESTDALIAAPSINLRADILDAPDEELLGGMLERFAPFSGVSGVQSKFLVRDEDAARGCPLAGTTHIVKTFDPSAFPGLAFNEWVCLQAAGKAGLPIPVVEVSADGRWLAVERFDLVNSGDDSRYLAFEDMCSLSGNTSAAKYHGSYEQIASVIQDFSCEPTEDLSRFFSMVALSCALRNGDAHRKNFGMLYEGRDDVRLAPAFDVICTDVYPELESKMALSMDGMEAWPDARRLERFGIKHCQLEPQEVRNLVSCVCEAAVESLSLLSDERMPRATANAMRLAVEFGVASLRGSTNSRMRRRP